MTIGNICNREVIIAFKQDTLAEAVRLMREHHVGNLVIIENQGARRIPVGILTDRDILVSVIGEGLDPAQLLVEDVMSSDLVIASIDSSLEETLKLMRSRGVRRLPVIDDDNTLVGILTLDDIIDLLAEEISDLAALIRNEQKREVRKTV